MKKNCEVRSVKFEERVGGAGDGQGYGYCRFAAERMLRMHRMIEDRQHPNASTLAREFELSVRTIKRDIDFMKIRLNLPIAFDVLRKGQSRKSEIRNPNLAEPEPREEETEKFGDRKRSDREEGQSGVVESWLAGSFLSCRHTSALPKFRPGVCCQP